MSLALVLSRALAGIEAPEVAVEVHLGPGLPAFHIVGLPEAEVREAKDRVRAALNHARFDFPQRRITVNLAPADLPKDSSRFDLPIALGILAASGQLQAGALADCEFAGELSLSGELRPMHGAFAIALRAKRARRAFVLPAANADEAALAGHVRVLPARTLLEVCAHLAGQSPIAVRRAETREPGTTRADLRDVKGQSAAKRALEVAAAGEHGVLLIGPPGTGKSMLAARFPGLLPPPSEREALEIAALHSVSSRGFDVSQWAVRPFRAPHHSASSRALVGGGNPPRPGEISLAHGGVLFLDELPEFARDALEALREPLETGIVSIARAARQAQFPARFQLVAAMNPCRCGFFGHPRLRCRCTPEQVDRYRAKLSGPLLDRIDLRVEVPALEHDEILAAAAGEDSAAVRTRVTAAHRRQIERQGCANARLEPEALARHCVLERAGRQLLAQALDQLGLSARAVHRVLAVARTVADLAGDATIRVEQLAEAIQHRRAARP
ncbi:MAG: YifB family Mg chelatase-like AAA ATPase [Burkholderiales bacterium]|nr:YifB family Mg chelatase-like AAA ATPase [Burkholderiales bacterium]